MLIKVAIATAAAWWVGTLLGVPRPVFAALAVIVSIQEDLYGSLRAAVRRIIGVAVGVALGLLAERGPGASPLVVGTVMAVAFAAGDLLEAGPGINTQVGISALLVLATAATSGYGIYRFWETVLGGATAVASAALIWPGDPVAEAHRACETLRRQWAAGLRATIAATGDTAALEGVQGHLATALRSATARAAGPHTRRPGWARGDRLDRIWDALDRTVALLWHTSDLARNARDVHGHQAGNWARTMLALPVEEIIAAEAALARGDTEQAADHLSRATSGCAAADESDGPPGHWGLILELRHLTAELRSRASP